MSSSASLRQPERQPLRLTVVASNPPFAIDRDIPVPTTHPTTRYPWREMEVGDSFFVPGKTQREMAGSATGAGGRLGRRFIVRTERNGARVWRQA